MKTVCHAIVAALIAMIQSGCSTDRAGGTVPCEPDVPVGTPVPCEQERPAEDPVRRHELSDGRFKLECVKAGNEPFSIVAVTNLREDVTSEDLRRFGAFVFAECTSRILSGKERTAHEDEELLHFGLEASIGAMKDITEFAASSMQPKEGQSGVPNDFVGDGVQIKDVSQLEEAGQVGILPATPRENLTRIRSTCRRNLARCDTGSSIASFGKDFWETSSEAFFYQLALANGELRNHKEDRYLKPCLRNLWGFLRTNDGRLAAYVVRGDVTQDRLTVDRQFKQAFAEMDSLAERIDRALETAGDKRSRDILNDIHKAFRAKNDKLKADLNMIIIDIPVAIYSKIALNEIDQAKGLDDNEKEMIAALVRFRDRTENGTLIKKVKDGSAAYDIFQQLVEKARDELGDDTVEGILGRAW